MTDREFAERALAELTQLGAECEFDDRQEAKEDRAARALQIIERAVAEGRREGELSGITRGTRYACDVHKTILNTMLLAPIRHDELEEEED